MESVCFSFIIYTSQLADSSMKVDKRIPEVGSRKKSEVVGSQKSENYFPRTFQKRSKLALYGNIYVTPKGRIVLKAKATFVLILDEITSPSIAVFFIQ